MSYPSDKAVLCINGAVRNLRYLFAGEYGFSWSENEDTQQFEISVSWLKQYPPETPDSEGMAMVQFQTCKLDYADVEGYTADEISGAVFAELSKAETEGFGDND